MNREHMKRMERMDRLSGLASFCRATALVLALAPVFSHAAPPKKAGADSPPGDVYFKQITLDEAAQFISQIGKTSIVVTSSVANKVVSLYLRDVSVEGMVKNL
ncbi:MAG: hypothetical protein LBF50_08000, partial [Azoarcus sp.]|nr:hypothetical protein [Azoarcus sp.]